MKRIFLIMIAMIFMFPILSFATQVTIDLEKVKPDEAAIILQAKKVSENPAAAIPEADTVEKYAKWGKEIGSALGEVCKTLNVEANSFVKTPVGSLVAGLIIYHYFGKDMLKLILVLVFSLSLALATTISMRWWLTKKKVVVKQEGKLKEYDYIDRVDFKTNDGRGACIGLHVASYFVSLTTVVIMLIGL
jgi:hypothetical protein